MTQLHLQAIFIAQINTLNQVPLPIYKMIIDWTLDLILNTKKMTYLSIKKIERILSDQNVQLDHPFQHCFQSLLLLFKHALKQNFTTKMMKIFLQENLIIHQQHLQYILEASDKLFSSKKNSLVMGSLVSHKWAIFNLKSDQNGKQINKLYSKMSIQTSQGMHSFTNSAVLTLNQLRIVIQDTQKAANSLKR